MTAVREWHGSDAADIELPSDLAEHAKNLDCIMHVVYIRGFSTHDGGGVRTAQDKGDMTKPGRG